MRRLTLRPIELREAKRYVREHHRHHRPPLSHRFSLAAWPVARFQQDGETVEITRLCTDGTVNACSFLVGAAKRAARALGYKRMISYTLESEPGASWRASGMEQTGTVAGQAWEHTPGKHNRRPVSTLFGHNSNNDHPLVDKRRWEIRL